MIINNLLSSWNIFSFSNVDKARNWSKSVHPIAFPNLICCSNLIDLKSLTSYLNLDFEAQNNGFIA